MRSEKMPVCHPPQVKLILNRPSREWAAVRTGCRLAFPHGHDDAPTLPAGWLDAALGTSPSVGFVDILLEYHETHSYMGNTH